MNKKVSILVLSLSLCCTSINAQEVQKSDLQKKAEAAQTVPAARYEYIRAYEDYAGKGQLQQAVECGAKAASLAVLTRLSTARYKESVLQDSTTM